MAEELGKLHYVECTCTLNMLGVGMKHLGPLSNDKLSIVHVKVFNIRHPGLRITKELITKS